MEDGRRELNSANRVVVSYSFYVNIREFSCQVDLSLSADALRLIAKQALEKKTGARGLRAILVCSLCRYFRCYHRHHHSSSSFIIIIHHHSSFIVIIIIIIHRHHHHSSSTSSSSSFIVIITHHHHSSSLSSSFIVIIVIIIHRHHHHHSLSLLSTGNCRRATLCTTEDFVLLSLW